jgi:hypothetical protein
VRTSAPGGWDWNSKVCSGGGEGFDDSHSGMDTEEPEQPASIDPITAAKVAMTSATRDMTLSAFGGEARPADCPGKGPSICSQSKYLWCKTDVARPSNDWSTHKQF